MWFTKNNDGYRAWLTVENKNGALRTGGVSGDFVATVVDPTGATPTILSVSEAAGKPGLYTFLVPSSFFATHGVGGYGVVVETLMLSSPKVTATYGEVLRVFEEDFDSVAAAVVVASLATQYLGAIHIDTRSGSAGAVAGVNGTPGNPVNNLADAVTLAASLGLREYQLTGPITLTSAHPDWRFVGTSADASVDINGQDVSNSLFRELELTGALGAGPIVVIGGTLNNVSNLEGQVTGVAIEGVVTLGSNGATFFGSANGNVDGTAVEIDTNGAASFTASAFAGDLNVTNVTDPGQTIVVGLSGGTLVLDATNTNGAVAVGGIGSITDASAGTTVTSTLFSAGAVWQEVLDGTVTAQEIMVRINAMARGAVTLDPVQPTCPTVRSTYYDESGSPLYTNENDGNVRTPI